MMKQTTMEKLHAYTIPGQTKRMKKVVFTMPISKQLRHRTLQTT